MKFSILFNFLFAIIFTLHNSAWAYAANSVDTKMNFENFVKGFNALSNEEKNNLIRKVIMLEQRPDSDQSLRDQILNEVTGTFPTLKANGNEISVELEGKNYAFSYIKENIIEFHGEKIDVGAGNLNTAFEKLENISLKKSSGIMNFIFSDAHAAVSKDLKSLLKFLGAAIGIALLSPFILSVAATGLTIVFWLGVLSALVAVGGVAVYAGKLIWKNLEGPKKDKYCAEVIRISIERGPRFDKNFDSTKYNANDPLLCKVKDTGIDQKFCDSINFCLKDSKQDGDTANSKPNSSINDNDKSSGKVTPHKGNPSIQSTGSSHQ